ncbi:hypothetical protein C8J57DRAFT_418524 [Mycena rebaudengoi]|nr:hypothetical protein C8J57DRAFT_418524 [Mycena rebaudengoi]
MRGGRATSQRLLFSRGSLTVSSLSTDKAAQAARLPPNTSSSPRFRTRRRRRCRSLRARFTGAHRTRAVAHHHHQRILAVLAVLAVSESAPATTHPAPRTKHHTQRHSQHQQGQGPYAAAAAGVLGKPRDSYAVAAARETYASSLPGVTGTSSLGATHAYSAPAPLHTSKAHAPGLFPLQTSHMHDKMTSPTRYGCRGNGIHTRA